jgi:hypothetical protein
MPLAASSLSVAARGLRARLAGAIDGLVEQNVTIAHPKEGCEPPASSSGTHRLNLFFYDVSFGGHPADGTSDEPFYVRLSCLITALAVQEDTVSAGENDLRLLGEVMRVLHESPQFALEDGGETVALLQVVLTDLSLDDVNKIWSTQGDVAYRPSVAYELALAPVPLAGPPVPQSPLVVSIGVEARPDVSVPALPAEGFDVPTRRPSVAGLEVDGDNALWVPHAAFVSSGGELEYALVLDLAAAAADVDVLPVGKVGETLAVRWEVWTAAEGWLDATASPSETVQVGTDRLDPAAVDAAHVRSLTSPLAASPVVPSQALLHLVRDAGTGGELRSNSLLLTVTAVTSP